MRLLICTQTVDTEDPTLGFFHRWIEEFAKHCEQIVVICLREGEHRLPKNVSVYSLGKEKRISSRSVYAWRFVRLIWKLRKEYNAVFVHMNSEYVLLGVPFWKLRKTPVGLWYTHKQVPWHLRIAERLATIIFTASSESFRLPSKKVRVVGHGIDTDFFTPGDAPRGANLLSVGRLMPSKRHDLAIRAAALLGAELRIVGAGPEMEALKRLANELGVESKVHFVGGVTQKVLREEYRRAAALVHTSETGSLDKVLLEAIACGLPVVTTDKALMQLPLVVAEPSAASIVEGLGNLPPASAEYVQKNHSLSALVARLIMALASGTEKASDFYQTLSHDGASAYEKARWTQTPIAKAHKKMHHTMVANRVGPFLRGAKTYLEIGPGPGTWTKVLLAFKKDLDVTLVDISESMLKEAAEAVAPHPVRIEAGDFLDWDRKGRTFDFVFSSRAIEYFSDKKRACKKIQEALVSGGRGVLITKNPHRFRDTLLLRGQSALHGGQLTPYELKECLEKAGLRVLSMYPVTMTLPLFRSPTASTLLWQCVGKLRLSFVNSWAAESYAVFFEKV